jgi:16S rRNA (cytidine1402-2'-O)-methyltransferase
MIGRFYVVATPIGNLADISERAKATLASVDVVLCEDTRVTGKLLYAYQIQTKMLSYHQHSGGMKVAKIVDLLKEGKSLALVTDAGTPAISDPGAMLIQELISRFGEDIIIEPIPGASAVITALSVSGFPADEFSFLGFAPHKKGRQTFFDRVAVTESTVVLYESTHRITKALEEIHIRMPDRPLVVARELTKMHETIYRGTAKEIVEQLASTSSKGEFVIVLKQL